MKWGGSMEKSLPKIGKPAENALNDIGINTLEQVARISENTLLKIHGVGPKAVKILKDTLKEKGMTFKSDIGLPISPDFACIGDLGCDNAPKRKVIRDFIIARTAVSQKLIDETVNPECVLEKAANGKYHVSEFEKLLSIEGKRISTLMVNKIISHGKEGAAETVITLTNSDKIHTADFFTFENHKKDAKIIYVKTFVSQ